MTTIVCCPSTRTKLEKALVRKYDERQAARRRGAREDELEKRIFGRNARLSTRDRQTKNGNTSTQYKETTYQKKQ
ncbi:hypothetical protein OXYTRIMIC_598 [Oxytricha trifallax]|uniref:Uncharacterized protein n=1 Tax=Oxytricha trifallax TaxID=1172189 RepID=A0A073ICK1_9SPIT|nr:hypothetical protein OXYTRIMIC_598 [Oxytricha trifallax]